MGPGTKERMLRMKKQKWSWIGALGCLGALWLAAAGGVLEALFRGLGL